MSDVGTSITIKVTGVDKYQNRLRKINQKLENLEAPTREAGKIALALAKSYPPYGNWKGGQISFVTRYPGAKYVRTRTLQKAWKGQLRKGSKVLFTYRVFNYGTIDKRGRPYFKYVQGQEQAPPHPGRWYTEDQMKPMMEAEAAKIFKKYMKDVAKT